MPLPRSSGSAHGFIKRGACAGRCWKNQPGLPYLWYHVGRLALLMLRSAPSWREALQILGQAASSLSPNACLGAYVAMSFDCYPVACNLLQVDPVTLNASHSAGSVWHLLVDFLPTMFLHPLGFKVIVYGAAISKCDLVQASHQG